MGQSPVWSLNKWLSKVRTRNARFFKTTGFKGMDALPISYATRVCMQVFWLGERHWPITHGEEKKTSDCGTTRSYKRNEALTVTRINWQGNACDQIHDSSHIMPLGLFISHFSLNHHDFVFCRNPKTTAPVDFFKFLETAFRVKARNIQERNEL
ncbi:unnamed protein product [Brugia pahangi]|uniref:Secreted protein n=1 Tax=Brugia pahangi TaxID=6280 RepID=A0A0N4TR73_BRUPA|nr:unnamed protein product [Brugia pahangi]